MRILYLCTDPGVDLASHGGGAVHICCLVKALRNLGHEVALVCHAAVDKVPGAPNSDAHLFPLRLAAWNRTVARSIRAANRFAGLKGRHHPDVVRALHNYSAFRMASRVVGTFRPDVVYERYTLWGMAGIWLARKHSLPLMLEVNAPLAYEQQLYRGLMFPSLAQRAELSAWRGSKLVIGVSQPLCQQLQEAGVQSERIRVLPNAVDASLFRADLDGDAVRKRFQLGNRFVVGFLGTFKQWHGVDLLLEAFRELHRAEPEFHLLLIGDGPLRESLQRKVQEEKLHDAVTFTGQVPHQEVPPYLAAMDVAVAPYPDLGNFYFSPLKLFEYMAVHRAVVASRSGQISEILVDGKNGLLFEAGNVAELIRCIRRLKNDPELRLSLGKEAGVGSQSYTWSKNARQVIAWAESLVAQVRQPLGSEEPGLV